MKFSPLQSDFSKGELSPKAQGRVDSALYKAGLYRLANVIPSQPGSIASRAGGRWVAGPADTATDAYTFYENPAIVAGAGSAVVVVHDSPYGNIAIFADGRIFDEDGNRITWTTNLFGGSKLQKQAGLGYNFGARDFTLRNPVAAYKAIMTLPVAAFPIAQRPPGSNGSVLLTFDTSGSDLLVEVLDNSLAVVFSTTAAAGHHSYGFFPAQGVNFGIFQIRFSTLLDTVATTHVFNLDVTFNKMITNGGPIPVTHQGACASFWVGSQFFIVFVRPGAVPKVLWWAGQGYADRTTTEWYMRDMVFAGHAAPSWAYQVSSCIAYQGRLWFGCDDAFGSIHASEIGYGFPTTAGGAITFGGDFNFRFDAPSQDVTSAAAQTVFPFTFTTTDPLTINVTKNGVKVSPTIALNANQDTNPGGTATFGAGLAVGDRVNISRLSGASDALDLKLASPTGEIAWLEVLRGLMLGTTKKEQVFGSNLSVDPATGLSIDIQTECAYGSKLGLPAIPVENKIAFVTPGGKRMRMIGQSMSTFGGLFARDMTVIGEHLLTSKVQTFCFLRAPTPRFVFGFGDGTGAIAVLDSEANELSWARFTMPNVMDGFLSVAAMDATEGTKLWVATGDGQLLCYDTLDSDITATSGQNPYPPVMDGWRLRPIDAAFDASGQIVSGLPTDYIGQDIWVLYAGQALGPYVGYGFTEGTVRIPLADLAFAAGKHHDVTRTDSDGSMQPCEVYVGLAYPEHKIVTLPLEGGDPAGSSQGEMSRRVQCYARFVDSYMPIVGLFRAPERGGSDEVDVFAHRVTGDRRITQSGFQRGAKLEIIMDKPLRMEISAIFGGTAVNNL